MYRVAEQLKPQLVLNTTFTLPLYYSPLRLALAIRCIRGCSVKAWCDSALIQCDICNRGYILPAHAGESLAHFHLGVEGVRI